MKKAGYSVSEVSEKIQKFKNLGLNQHVIDALISNPKSMEIGDDVLKLIGKTGDHQKLIAELVLENGDEFSLKLIELSKGETFENWIQLAINNGTLNYKEANVFSSIGKNTTELDEVDFVKSIIYEDKSAKGLYIDNPSVPQTEVEWAANQILSKGKNRINALSSDDFSIRIKENSQWIDYTFTKSELQKIKNYVFRINEDTPELREAVNNCIVELNTQYPSYNFKAIFGGE